MSWARGVVPAAAAVGAAAAVISLVNASEPEQTKPDVATAPPPAVTAEQVSCTGPCRARLWRVGSDAGCDCAMLSRL